MRFCASFSTFSLCLFSFDGCCCCCCRWWCCCFHYYYCVAVTAVIVVIVVVTHTHGRRIETHPTTLPHAFLSLFSISLSLSAVVLPTNALLTFLFIGRNRPIVKSPSLNIERSDVTDNVNQQGGTDQQLLAHIEQLILNDESKWLSSVFIRTKSWIMDFFCDGNCGILIVLAHFDKRNLTVFVRGECEFSVILTFNWNNTDILMDNWHEIMSLNIFGKIFITLRSFVLVILLLPVTVLHIFVFDWRQFGGYFQIFDKVNCWSWLSYDHFLLSKQRET